MSSFSRVISSPFLDSFIFSYLLKGKSVHRFEFQSAAIRPFVLHDESIEYFLSECTHLPLSLVIFFQPCSFGYLVSYRLSFFFFIFRVATRQKMDTDKISTGQFYPRRKEEDKHCVFRQLHGHIHRKSGIKILCTRFWPMFKHQTCANPLGDSTWPRLSCYSLLLFYKKIKR